MCFIIFFTNKNFQASVVCRELGYIGAVSATTNSHFGDVSGTFSYSNVYCTGDEASLDVCRNYNNPNCYESEGAGVICNTNPPTKGKKCISILINFT